MAKEKVEKQAHIIPTGVFPAEGGVRVSVKVVATDRETGENALRDFAMETGAYAWEGLREQSDGDSRSSSGRSFHFSGDKWKAPWQPTGPRPNWGYEPSEKADPTKPIN